MLARFREAGELARRDPKAGAAMFDQLSADSSIGRPMQDLAAVRAATLLVDTEPARDPEAARAADCAGARLPARRPLRCLRCRPGVPMTPRPPANGAK